jgi:hypothetical protein
VLLQTHVPRHVSDVVDAKMRQRRAIKKLLRKAMRKG